MRSQMSLNHMFKVIYEIIRAAVKRVSSDMLTFLKINIIEMI